MRTQIKIFEGNGNNETEINEWLAKNPNIQVQKVDMLPLFDRFYNCDSDGHLNICNQWIATIVIYSDQTGCKGHEEEAGECKE